MADPGDEHRKNLAEAQATIDGMRKTLAVQESALKVKELELEAKAGELAAVAAEVERLKADVDKWRRIVRENQAGIAALQAATDNLVAVWGKPPTVN